MESVVTQIGHIEIEGGNTLNEQIALDDRRAKLQKEIDKLEKQAWAEKQPKRKFELMQKIREMRNSELEEKFGIRNSEFGIKNAEHQK